MLDFRIYGQNSRDFDRSTLLPDGTFDGWVDGMERWDRDVKRGEPGEYDAVAKTAAAVSPLVNDPVNGGDGTLRKLWADDIAVRC